MNRLTIVRDGEETIAVVLELHAATRPEVAAAENTLAQKFIDVPVLVLSNVTGPPVDVRVVVTPYADDPNPPGASRGSCNKCSCPSFLPTPARPTCSWCGHQPVEHGST